jgi:hypothetical protein
LSICAGDAVENATDTNHWREGLASLSRRDAASDGGAFALRNLLIVSTASFTSDKSGRAEASGSGRLEPGSTSIVAVAPKRKSPIISANRSIP